MRPMLLIFATLALAPCNKQGSWPAPDRKAANEKAGPGPRKGVDRSHKGQAAPAAEFDNPDGGKISIAKFKGVPVLVNLWASWCAPCVKELPTLDKLAANHRDDGLLGVMAVRQDSGPQASVVA